ncbi:MAG: hypothetical protein U0414_38790 [Polyangiaceae bacterium]
MRRALLTAAVGVLALGSACSGPPPPRPILTPPSPDVDVPPAFTSPARWVYFPRDVSVPSATLVLPDKSCLVTTLTGDRWLLHGPEDRPCTGQGVASASPIYEALSGIVASPAPDGQSAEYRFVSASGRIFTATEPLGPFVKFTKVDKPFVQVASAKGEIVGVDGGGAISFFDAATSTWKRAQQPAGSRALRVGLDEDGRALAITMPEGVLTSSDAGKTFSAFGASDMAAPPHIGATDVMRTSAGELALDGAVGRLVWLKSGAFQRSTEELTAGTVEATIERSSNPIAGSLREQRGSVSGDRYHDLRYPDAWMKLKEDAGEDTSPYVLTRGPLGGPLDFVQLHGMTGCIDLRLGANGKNVVIACSHTTESSNLGVSLFASADDGDTLHLAAEFTAQNFADVFLDVGPDGSVLVTNVCRTDVQRKKKTEDETVEEQCKPRAPVYVRIKGEESTIVQGTTPRHSRPSFSPLVGVDNHLYYIGHRIKDERAVIMVSTDAGKTWTERPVELPEAADESTDPLAYAYSSLDLSPEYGRLTMDESGTIGVVGQTQAGLVWVTADTEGRVGSVAAPPENGTLGGFGRRLIAVSYGNGDGVTRAWESIDGGASFSEIATTGAISNLFNSGDGSIVCGASGCVLGDSLARVGWDGQAESQLNIVDAGVPMIDAKPGPGMTCELVPKSEWTPVKNIAVGTIHPRLREIMRGKSAWSVLTQDPTTHELDATSATLPDKESEASQVQQRALLGPFGNGKIGYAANWQTEGYVSARAAYNEKDGVIDSKPLSVEVAWVNYYLGTFGHRTIPDVQNTSGSLLQLTGGPLANLSPALMSIAGSGVALRPEWSSQETIFVDAGARTTKFDYVDWNDVGINGGIDGDVAMVGGDLFSVGFVSRATGNAFAIGRKPSSAPAMVEATTLSDSFAQADWTYFDGQSGISVILPGTEADKPTAFFLPLRADGSLADPIAMPTLDDLADRPRACSADDRKNTPRAYMPVFNRSTRTALFPNGRRPVLVTEGAKDAKSLGLSGPMWFLTDGAILHGTPKDPCVAGFRGSAVGQNRVVVIAGDLQHAWLFRPAPPTSGCLCDPNDESCDCSDPANQIKHDKNQVIASVEWRPMTCTYKPELVAPVEVASEITYPAPEDVP